MLPVTINAMQLFANGLL